MCLFWCLLCTKSLQILHDQALKFFAEFLLTLELYPSTNIAHGKKRIFFIFSFFLRAFSRSQSFNLSCPLRLASWLELGSQVGSTTDHLSSCCHVQPTKDLSAMRAELAEVVANRGSMNFYTPSKHTRAGNYPDGFFLSTIEYRDRKVCRYFCKRQQLAYDWRGRMKKTLGINEQVVCERS